MFSHEDNRQIHSTIIEQLSVFSARFIALLWVNGLIVSCQGNSIVIVLIHNVPST